MGYLPTILVLGLAAVASVALVRGRTTPAELVSERRQASRALALATLLQAVHFVEEASTGFHAELGALLNLPAMPFAFFIWFNVAWLVIWILAVPGVSRGYSSGYFAAWFLSIAGMVNAVAHPALSILGGAYFPGTISSPLVGAACLWLFLKLRKSTTRR